MSIGQIDGGTLEVATESQVVDDANAKFYGRFPYPWECMRFDFCADQALESATICQAVGDWSHRRVPDDAAIWVAGCGTNQAVFVALRFPNARVIASDLSRESLAICAHSAKHLGLKNLELQNESINRLDYRERFDYVVCTGVIHHNADPAAALAKLRAALKPSGVLELMVYNRYHRIATSAIQEAVRILKQPSPLDLDGELALAKKILDAPLKNALISALAPIKEGPPSRVADALIQPVEYSYTVESLEALALSCGMTILAPCTNIVDRAEARLPWTIRFPDADLQARYEALTDIRRWQLLNLLLFERSPMLWFYMQRTDSAYPRKSERTLDEEFLDRPFVRVDTLRQAFTRDSHGVFAAAPSFPFPGPPADPRLRPLWEAVDGTQTMRDVFQRQGVPLDRELVHRARILLTTPAGTHLRARA